MGVELEGYHFVTRTYGGTVGGGCTKAAWELHPSLDYWMGTTGEPKLTVSGGITTNGNADDPGGFTKFDLIKTGAFVNVPVGVVCYLETDGGNDFFVVISNPDNNTIWFRGDLESLEGSPTAVYLGGAYNSLATALGSQNVNDQNTHQTIFTNKNENLTSAITVQKGNSLFLLTISGFQITPGDSGSVTFNCNGNSIHAMDIVDTMTAKIRNIKVHNTGKPTGYYGFYVRKDAGLCFGMAFENCEADGFDRGFCITADIYNVQFSGCYAFENNTGFYLRGSSEIVDRCCSYDNTQKGINCTHSIISNSLFYDNGTGIYFDDGSGMVLNCTLYNNSSYGIHLFYAGQMVSIYNTIVSGSGTKNLYGQNNGLLIGDYNCLYNGGGANSGYFAGANDLNVNPQFADADSGSFRTVNPALRKGMVDLNGYQQQIGAINPNHPPSTRNRPANMARLAIMR